MIEGLQSTRRSRVLVADDTESVRSLFERLLSSDGHDVVSATDGRGALDAIQRERPDVILLDVEMPGMDGLEVCRRLKADPATRLTPVSISAAPTRNDPPSGSPRNSQASSTPASGWKYIIVAKYPGGYCRLYIALWPED